MLLGRWGRIASLAVGAFAGVSILNGETDGHIFSAAPDASVPAWSELPEGYREQVSRAELDRVRSDRRFECRRIVYASGGLRVEGFVYKPVKPPRGASLPLVIYNRGGNGDYGAIDSWDKVIFHRLAEGGFVVLASQYRGGGRSEGRDEFGGADLQDVLSLFPLARDLGYADMSNVFMLGFSRGGMMTYLAIRGGAPIRAAAVVGGVSDLPALAAYRPRFLSLWATLWPSFSRDSRNQMLERSAIHWPELLDKPLLLLHGAGDRRVPLDQSLRLADAIRGAGRSVEVRVFPDDEHDIGRHSRERDDRVIGWFRAHVASRRAS